MRRTKKWWHCLNRWERQRLVVLERSSSGPYGGGGYLPDDCTECQGCGQPQLGSGLCIFCGKELQTLIAKANSLPPTLQAHKMGRKGGIHAI